MPVSEQFQLYIEELFSSFEKLRIRKMFDGAGVYSGQDLFALISNAELFIKADDGLRKDLEARGGKAYRWTNPDTGKTVSMSFVSIPGAGDVDPPEVLALARKSLEIAQGARHEKVKSPRRFSI